MCDKTQKFFNELKGKKVAFIGTGVSHMQTIELFLKKGVTVTVCDKKTKEQLQDKYDTLKSAGADFSLGEDYLRDICGYDVIFRTPGMSWHSRELVKAREAGCAVTSEMEVFFDLCPCKIYAVTGSDGKTTTTTLIGEMLKKSGKTVHVGGNIGRALLPEIENIDENDAAVVELSSFQLISMRRSPDVAVVTNVAPNHLDVHKNMEEYIGCKKNLIVHQNAFSKTVLNADNDITCGMEYLVRGRLLEFSRKKAVKSGTYLRDDGKIVTADRNGETVIMDKDDIKLPGIHNVENYLAAISAVCGDVSVEDIIYVARNFSGVEHRIEFVREKDGVRWYNDSIATSPTRTIAGLNSFDRKLIVIAGGYDKKIPYEPLAPYIIDKVKCLVLMGATAEKIETAVREAEGFSDSGLEILHAESMEDAVVKAKEFAKRGDIVTLSPASASFDKYVNFEVRGNHYKSLVNAL